jgi:branched-chain amino acid transport system ATP-binding protein
MLEVIDLGKSYGGVQAVANVGFTLQAREMLALIGPNGAGKSTCFNMLGGQVRADSGRIVLEGRNIAGLPPHRIWQAGIGRTFQISAPFRSMTVRENVQLALLSHHRSSLGVTRLASRAYSDEADALLEQTGLKDQAERGCAALAYGDVKRLELAIALSSAPRLLLLDEPTAGMSVRERAAMMELVTEVVAARGVALLFTEHDMDAVFRHAHRILVMSRGHLIADGPPSAIREDPEVRRVYLGGGSRMRGAS